MKAFDFLIIFIFLNGIYSTTYDLKNGIRASFKLEFNNTYYFYIPMNQFQAAKIYIDFKELPSESSIPFSDIHINEYLTKDGINLNSSNINLIKTEKQGNLSLESDYFFDENQKNYIALILAPNTSIGNIEILIDIFGGYYEMEEGKYLDFDKFYSGYPYFLEFRAKSGDSVNINLSFSKIHELDIDNLTIIEYKDNNHTIALNSTDYPLVKKPEIINSTTTLSHKIKNIETNIIIIKLFPKNITIASFHTNITIKKYYYYLNLDQPINVEKSIDTLYHFSIELNKREPLNISLDMICGNGDVPFITLAICEVEAAFDDKNIVTRSSHINTPSQSIIYNATNEFTKFLMIIFSPQIEFKEIKISYSYAKELITTYNLINGGSKDIINIYPNKPYYFDIENVSFLKTLYISFTIDNSRLPPFRYIDIYENLNRINNNYTKYNEYVEISWTKNQKQWKANRLFTIYDNSTSNITLYLKNEYFIKLLNFKIEMGGETYKLNDGSSIKYNSLSSKFKYFFIIDINKNINKNATFKYKLKNGNNKGSPFKLLVVYELSNKIIKESSSKALAIFDKDEKIDDDIYHKIVFNDTDQLMLEIEPSFDYDYIEIGVNLDYSKKDNFTLILVLSIVGAVVVIACIVLIVIVVKKKKQTSISIDKLPADEKSSELIMGLN